MYSDDTVELLRECDSGAKMGAESISEVCPYVKNDAMKQLLQDSREAHEDLAGQIREYLDACQEAGKSPSVMAKGMSWIKTNMTLSKESDTAIADLVTDGCAMGVKSLSRYLNKYQAAETRAKNMARELIRLETQLETDLRSYL